MLCAGALAGSITGVATTPLDVIKTRLMTQGSKRTYSGVLDCATKIAQQEGVATFLQVTYIADTSNKTRCCRGFLAHCCNLCKRNAQNMPDICLDWSCARYQFQH